MSRYIGPNCRLCRSQKQKLFLKGERCLSLKCPVDKKTSILRKGPPGKPSTNRLKKLSNYGVQLKEKQKLKNFYGVTERQFKRYFEIAIRKKGVTGDNLILQLETRLDNIIYRMHIASSRKQARQLILHGHIKLNNKLVNIPSYNVKKGDIININENSKKMTLILESLKRVGTDGIVPWLDINPDEVQGTVKDIPQRNDIKFVGSFNEQLVVELYSK